MVAEKKREEAAKQVAEKTHEEAAKQVAEKKCKEAAKQVAVRDSDHRASLKRKRVHELRDLCGELAVEANGTKAQMIEHIVAARTAPPAESLANAPGKVSTDGPDPAIATALATVVSGP